MALTTMNSKAKKYISILEKQLRDCSTMKEKLIFIAPTCHAKTKSCDFMFNYLKEFFDVDIYYNNSGEMCQEYGINIINSEYKYVVFWQNIPKSKMLNKIKYHHDNIIFFPMCDAIFYWDALKWLPYRNIKIINFSRTINQKLKSWGFNTIYIQYFIKPKEFIQGTLDEVFFWQRVNGININVMRQIFDGNLLKLHIHTAVDPLQEFTEPSKEDEIKYSITYSDWFDSKEEMLEMMKRKSIYIAPRSFEGIGISFLEAMALGKAVVANNKPTMNEYIQNGITGYLVDYENPSRVDFSNIKEIQKNTYQFMEAGYKNWVINRKKIVEFIKLNQSRGSCFTIDLILSLTLAIVKSLVRLRFISRPIEKVIKQYRKKQKT